MSAGTEPLWRLAAVRHLLIVSFLGFSSFCLTLAALPTWAVINGASIDAAGLVTTVMLGVTVATQGLVPAMMTRFGIGPSLAMGLILLGGPSPLYALGGQLGLLLGVSAVRGFGFALLTVIGATLTGHVAPPERHGESVGVYGLSIAVPNLIGVPLGVALTQNGHFGIDAVVAACPLLALPYAVRMGGRPGPALDADVVADAETVAAAPFSRRRVALLTVTPSLVLLVITAAGGGYVTFLPITRPRGALATVALLVFGAASAVARWRAGLLVDRLGARLLLPGALAFGAIGLTGVALCLLGGSAYDVPLLVAAAVFGLGYGAIQNLTLVVAFARAGPAGAPVASAVWNAAFDAGTALGAVGLGVLANTGLGVPWAYVVAASILAAFVPLAVRVPGRRPAR